MVAELTHSNANAYSGVFYRIDGTDAAVKLSKLDIAMLEDCASRGFVLSDDFHSGLVDQFLASLKKMGVEAEEDFWQKAPGQRSLQFVMQPYFLENMPKQCDLGLMVIKRGLETLAVNQSEFDANLVEPLDFQI